MTVYKDTITIKVTGLEEVSARIANFPDRFQTVIRDDTVLKEIGTQLVLSAITTLEQGGRPTLYKPLAQSTINRRWHKQQKRNPDSRANKQGIVSNAPLLYNGTLRKSLDYEISGGSLFLTSVDYLKYHQFEENRTKARFPARPVWGIQEDDIPEITDIIITNLQKSL